MNTQSVNTLRSAATPYDLTSRALHWLTLALLIVQFALGWSMPDPDSMNAPAGLDAWHIGVGTSLLAVLTFRLVWTLLRQSPEPIGQHRALRLLANVVHSLMYALLLLVPVLGWLNANGRGWTVKMAELMSLPTIATQDSMGAAIGEWHSAGATALLILIGIHVSGVLMHQIGFKDRIIRRML